MKSYTDLEQSKILKEILPIESADMIYPTDFEYPLMWIEKSKKDYYYIPCWSLAALLNYLREIDFFPEIDANELEVTMSITYFNDHEVRHLTPVHNITVKAESFIDACYSMIVKLNEMNLL